MANHNQYKKISTTPQANTIPYANEEGNISSWLDNDPVILALKQQNQFIGTVPTIPSGEDIQTFLTQFVYTTTGRQPRNGDEVAIEDVGELWQYNGTEWVFFTTTTLADASTTTKGLMQVGSGLLVTSGLVSVDPSIYTPSRTVITNTSTTPNLSIQPNTDYVFTNTLTSLTLNSVPSSQYFTTLTFTPATGFVWSAPNLTEYFFLDNPPTFIAGRKYELVITNGKCHINYIGAREYPINKRTYTNGALIATDNVVTWTISNSLATPDVFIRVYETANGNTVEVDSTVTLSTITLKLYTDNTTVSAGTYTAVILG